MNPKSKKQSKLHEKLAWTKAGLGAFGEEIKGAVSTTRKR